MIKTLGLLSRRSASVGALALFFALQAPAQVPANPKVKFQTSLGDFVVELQSEKAPKTVENFLRYVSDKHYDGTIFHRVIDGFMVQGGGFTAAMVQNPPAHPFR